jgi:hypothetical protein
MSNREWINKNISISRIALILNSLRNLFLRELKLAIDESFCCLGCDEFSLASCFSIYFSSKKRNNAKELREEPQADYNKANIKLNTSTSLSYMYIMCKKSTANRTAELGSFWTEAAMIIYVLSVTEYLLLNVATVILICAYKLRTANTTRPPLRIFVSQEPWHHFEEPWCSR